MSEKSFLIPDENENLNAGEMTLLAESIEKLHLDSQSAAFVNTTSEVESSSLSALTSNASFQPETAKTSASEEKMENFKDVLRETQNLTGNALPLKSVENVKNTISTHLHSEKEAPIENGNASKLSFNHSFQTLNISGNLNNLNVLDNSNLEVVIENSEKLDSSAVQIQDVSDISFSDALDTSFPSQQVPINLNECTNFVQQNIASHFKELFCSSLNNEQMKENESSILDSTDESTVQDQLFANIQTQLQDTVEKSVDPHLSVTPIDKSVDPHLSVTPIDKPEEKECEKQTQNSTACIEIQEVNSISEESDSSLNIKCELKAEEKSLVLEDPVLFNEQTDEVKPDCFDCNIDQSLPPENVPSQVITESNVSELNIPDNSIAFNEPSSMTEMSFISQMDEAISPKFNNEALSKTVKDFAFKMPKSLSSDDKSSTDDCKSELPENQLSMGDFAFQRPVNMENEEFTDAAKFFQDPSSFQFLENISTNAPAYSSIARSSLYMKFDPLVHSSVIQQLEKSQKTGHDNMLRNVLCNPMRQSMGNSLISFDSPVKNKMDAIQEDATSSPQFKDHNVIQQKVEDVSYGTENKINDSEKLLNVSQTDFPVFYSQDKSIDSVPCTGKISAKTYSEDDLQSALKDVELKLHEKFLQKQKEAEQALICLQNEKECEIENLKNLYEKKLSAAESPCNKSDRYVATTPFKNVTVLKSYSEDELNEILKKSNQEMEEKLSAKDKEVEQVLVNLRMKKEQEIVQLKELYEERLSKSDTTDIIKSDCCVGTTPLKPRLEVKSYSEEELQEAVQHANQEIEERSAERQKELEASITHLKEEKASEAKTLAHLCNTQSGLMQELSSIALQLKQENKELNTHVKDLESKIEGLRAENQTTQEDFQSVENTFADFHKRYEQCKSMLKTFKENEVHLKKELEKSKTQYETLKNHSEEALSKAEIEVASIRKSNDAQVAVLQAQLKKSEIKVLGLENDLVQARREKDELEGLCDNLMTKVSQS